jgi:hypothetical protein
MIEDLGCSLHLSVSIPNLSLSTSP